MKCELPTLSFRQFIWLINGVQMVLHQFMAVSSWLVALFIIVLLMHYIGEAMDENFGDHSSE